MAETLHASRPTTLSTANPGGRNYDYTKKYNPDKLGEEAKENARVWNVYLDEAENYDADMIEGFRNIIDGLLVFASLFSAVVTTFVAQTSQALQTDNPQIMVSLLVENNQLLRAAAGNKTAMSAVSTASLGPGSRTYTSIDVWINGLFFTSLALSLSTALLTVLAKQWIQAYTAIVPGGAKTRALIRHFRFQGLVKWKLGDIIESLPLILHGSVAIFLVGLALYVSQLSSPICNVVSAITALTFLFYFGTSMIPAWDIACPYRIAFMFSLARPLLFAFRATRYAFLHLWYRLTEKQRWVQWPEMSRKSLKIVERTEVSVNSEKLSSVSCQLSCDSLNWVFDHSSNHSVKEVVIEGVCGLLDEWSSTHILDSDLFDSTSSSSSIYRDLFLSTIVYSLYQLPNISSASTMEDEVERSTYGRLIRNLMKISSSKSLLDEPLTLLKDWQGEIEPALINAYERAVSGRYHALSRHLLDWGHTNLLQSGEVLACCAIHGKAEDIRDLVERGMDLNRRDSCGWTAMHYAATFGNLHAVVDLVEREPGLISDKSNPPVFKTALDVAIDFGRYDVVTYLLDHGATPPSDALHFAVRSALNRLRVDRDRYLAMIELFLDRGWDRTTKDADWRTPFDIARNESPHDFPVRNEDRDAIVEHLEHYQTVRLPPYPRCAEL